MNDITNIFNYKNHLAKLVKLFQMAIEEIADRWNCHKIRPSKNTNVPYGRPWLMYSLPHLYAVTDYICPVENDRVQMCEEEASKKGIPCDQTVFDLCKIILDEMSWELPSNPDDMCDMYIALRGEIRDNF